MTIQEAQKRIVALQARYPEPPTFEQFAEAWASMDELSKSLLEAGMNCPQLSDDGPYWRAVKGYLLQMGFTPGDSFDLVRMGKELESDPL